MLCYSCIAWSFCFFFFHISDQSCLLQHFRAMQFLGNYFKVQIGYTSRYMWNSETCVHFPLPYLSVQLQTIQLSLWRNRKYRWAAWAITRDSATVFKLSNLSSSLIFTKELNFLKDSVNVICPVCESVLQASSLTHLVSILSSSLFLDSSYIFCHTVFILCESHWFTERLLSKLAVFNRKPTWQVLSEALGSAFGVPFYEY